MKVQRAHTAAPVEQLAFELPGLPLPRLVDPGWRRRPGRSPAAAEALPAAPTSVPEAKAAVVGERVWLVWEDDEVLGFTPTPTVPPRTARRCAGRRGGRRCRSGTSTCPCRCSPAPATTRRPQPPRDEMPDAGGRDRAFGGRAAPGRPPTMPRAVEVPHRDPTDPAYGTWTVALAGSPVCVARSEAVTGCRRRPELFGEPNWASTAQLEQARQPRQGRRLLVAPAHRTTDDPIPGGPPTYPGSTVVCGSCE